MGAVLPLATSLSTLTATLLSAYLIHCHLKYMTMPAQQRRIIALLLLVPIYSITSLASISYPNGALYFDTLRDCYESYVIYSFLALLLCYIGESSKDDMNEEIVLWRLIDKRTFPAMWPLGYCYPIPEAEQFLLTCKTGVLQFFLIKPVTSLLAIVLHNTGLYSPEDLSLASSYIYLAAIINISMTFSLWYLVKFYYALRESLRTHNPVVKFASVKAILFFSYWQGVCIALLRWFGILDDHFGVSEKRLSTDIQNTLICAEMLVVSIVLQKAFSYKQYKAAAERPFPMGQLHHVLKAGFHDAVKDINQISPVVLPSGFKPKLVSSSKLESVELDTSAFSAYRL